MDNSLAKADRKTIRIYAFALHRFLQSRWTMRMAAAVLLTAASSFFTPLAAQQYIIQLEAQPRRIAADGRSTSQISATLTNALDSSPAPDGVEVRFSTTAGKIIPVARVTGGRATTVLTSASSANIAQVTALTGASSGLIEVEFVSGDFQAKPVVLNFEGELAYSIDMGIMLGAESTVTHEDLVIAAETIEFDERRGQIRAQGNVVATRGETSVSADALWYTPEDRAGAFLLVGRDNLVIPFRGEKLAIENPRIATDLQPFQAISASGTRSWITADRAVMWPRERIHFTRAVVTVDGRPALTLPHYFFDYQVNSFNPIAQQFRYTAFEGFVLDLPFYLRVDQKASSGVRVRYAEKGSSYGSFVTPRKGFTLGLEQTYDTGGGLGRVFLDSAPSDTRSLEWTHNQTASGGRRLNMNMRYQPKSDFAKNSLSGQASYYFSTPDANITLAAYGSRSESRGFATTVGSRKTLTTRIDARTPSRPIQGTGLSWSANGGIARGPVRASTSGRFETAFYQTLGVSLAHKPLSLPAGAFLTLDTEAQQGFGGFNRSSLRGRATLTRSIGTFGEAGLTWDQEFAGVSGTSAYRKSLTGSLSASLPTGLQGFAYLSWIPGDDATSISASVQQPLGSDYRAELSYTFQGSAFEDALGLRSTTRYNYTRFSVSRSFGIFDVSLSWSPQGRDFGLKDREKFWLELGSRAF